jgi:serine/threonine-protein kinase
MWLRPKSAKANTIAVLPFANLSGDPAQAYFSDGIAEELRSALAAIGGVQVVARTSSEMLRNADVQTAARRLSVMNVITGSVRRSPSTVRVSAQLVDGDTGIERWSQTFDRPFGDVLQIQSDIAASVARALSIQLGRGAHVTSPVGGTSNADAQDLLLQATALEGNDSSAGMLRRIALAERATQLDPNYAEAHARKGLYQTIWSSTWAADLAERSRTESEAERSIERAIAIAPTMPIAYSALGASYASRLMLKKSVEAFHRSVELPGASSLSFQNYAINLSRTGRQGQALSMIDHAIALDPLSAAAWTLKSWILFYGRSYPQSIEAARRALSLAPANLRSRTLLAWDLTLLGKLVEAERELQSVPADDYRRLVSEAVIAARTNRKDEGVRVLQTLAKRYPETVHYQLAEIWSQLGEKDKAIAALEDAWSTRDTGLQSARVDPFMDPIRRDPRFQQIVNRAFA